VLSSLPLLTRNQCTAASREACAPSGACPGNTISPSCTATLKEEGIILICLCWRLLVREIHAVRGKALHAPESEEQAEKEIRALTRRPAIAAQKTPLSSLYSDWNQQWIR
jgi:hypothetical protein